MNKTAEEILKKHHYTRKDLECDIDSLIVVMQDHTTQATAAIEKELWQTKNAVSELQQTERGLVKKLAERDKALHIADVMPMLHKIAKCFDDYLEDLDPKDCTEDLSNAVELMRDIADDNSMFIRN